MRTTKEYDIIHMHVNEGDYCMTNKFAQRLSLAISQSGMTPAEISRKTGITEGAISSYKAGRYKAKQDYVYLLSQCLGVSPGWLMGFDVCILSVKRQAIGFPIGT